MDLLNIGAAGMMAASQRLDASAVRQVREIADPVAAAVDQMLSKQAFQASASVFKTADKMLGSLLDIKV